LRQPRMVDYASSKTTGANLPRLSPKALAEFEIPLPPLSEQKRIADILDKADSIRRKRQEALTFRNQFLQSTFLEMFGDPATNSNNLPLRELSEFYVNPKDGTKCGPFGGALKKEEYVPAGVPVWNMDNIADDGRLVPNIRLWISKEKYEDLSSYSVKDGDIIISRAGTVGKMCVVRAGLKESIISTNLIRLRLNSLLIPEFFVSLMVFFKGRAGRLKTGPDGAFTHMSTGVLDKLTFPCPSVGAQRDFVSIMEQMDCSTHRLTMAVNEVSGLFNSLVQRAFKGEL
jgi:type I restriction enzyme S subunit